MKLLIKQPPVPLSENKHVGYTIFFCLILCCVVIPELQQETSMSDVDKPDADVVTAAVDATEERRCDVTAAAEDTGQPHDNSTGT